jgi:hypothetical protein
VNWKFWKKRATSSADVETKGSWPHELLKSEALLNFTKLSSQQLELEDIESNKELLQTLAQNLYLQSSKGFTQTKIFLHIYHTGYKFEAMGDITMLKGYNTHNGLNAAITKVTDDLRKLGYQVRPRPIDVNINRLEGGNMSRFLGTELLIAWG